MERRGGWLACLAGLLTAWGSAASMAGAEDPLQIVDTPTGRPPSDAILLDKAKPSTPPAGPIAMRISSFTVAPAHMPQAVVLLRNASHEPIHGKLGLRGPAGWLIVPAEQEISAPPGETVRAAFTVQRGATVEANSYPMAVSLTANGTTTLHKQEVVCASAPYFRPNIDGQIDEWKDAIPVTFVTGGKKVVISTYWNRRQLAYLVAVEEDNLVPWRGDASERPCDAIQVAISAADRPRPASVEEGVGRYEFLLMPTESSKDGRGKARCFQLADSTTRLDTTQMPRDLTALTADNVEVVVTRKEHVTYYECAIPWNSLPEIAASEGREFCFSVLVHDPDGTGIRDWGQAAGLWSSERNRLAWSVWPGARWDNDPFDSKTPWGMCSSKY